jgi:Flp pilus assembly protein TadD/tRNA A-37 threonylcarbamoyl transferase component Bud32
MDPTVTDRDFRLVELLDQALTELRAGRALDTATWQGLAPDLDEDLPRLLETMRDLDTAAQTWRCGRTLAPEQTGAAAPDPEVPLPAQVGRYEILGLLGAGGMGRVYKARDPQLDRVVAVKVPRFDGSDDGKELRKARFLREARAAAAVLHHPHVCPIHDVGEEDGLPYVVMAYIEGQSLADRLRTQGRYEDARAAVALTLQVASALEKVHAHGIVHRDLKPGNILLDRTGTSAHLSDFGLARPGDSGEHLTVEGDLLGTPAYMASEQAAGQLDQVGPWTDLYSLGVVLFQMLTGRLPFEGPTTLSVLHKITSELPPPPSRFRGDLDPTLDAVVQKALARQPEERYQSARAFAEALQCWLSGVPQPTVDEGAPRTATGSAAPTHTGEPALTLTAGPEPAPAANSQTVVLSGLPEGQSLQLSLPAGAKADVKVTMTGGGEGKRTRKKRPWRVTVSISLSVAALLLAVGVSLYIHSLSLDSSGSGWGRSFAFRGAGEEHRGGPPHKGEDTARDKAAKLPDEKFEKKGPADALFAAQEAVRLNPEDAAAHIALGNLLRDRGDADGAVARYNRAIELKANFPQAHFNLGVALERKGQLDKAVAAYRQAIRLKKDFAVAHNNLGDILVKQGQPKEAEAAFRTALVLQPNYPESCCSLGNSLLDQKRLEEAEVFLRRAIALKPGYALAHHNLGRALSARNDLNGAIKEFQAAIALAPNLSEARSHLSLTLLQSKLAEAAQSASRPRLQNWAFNTAVLGDSPAPLSTGFFSYTPYPPVQVGLSPPTTVASAVTMEYAPAFVWAGDTITVPSGAVGVYYATPYWNAYGGYNSYNNPYYPAGVADSADGSAVVMHSYGQLTMQQGQARLLREQAQQARFETRKKVLDTVLYLRANTPTFTAAEPNIARLSLQLAQGSATPAEIWSGKSLNALLDLLKKQRRPKIIPVAALPSLDENVLKHLNVTVKGGNLGLLRAVGPLTWPDALRDLVPQPERTNLEKETRRLLRQAGTGTPPAPAPLNALRADLKNLVARLVQQVNEIPPSQYIQARRFLSNFQVALEGLDPAEVAAYFDFRSKFAKGSKTPQELLDYMAAKGLRFAAATPGDEAAYLAIHRALLDWSAALENRRDGNPPSKE